VQVILLGFIQLPQFREWQGTRLAMNRGIIEPRKYVAPAAFARFLEDRAKRMAAYHAQMSPRQKKKIDDSLRSNLDRAAESETITAMSHDVAMFGEFAFEPEDEGS
jgi:hypothetical protein